MSPWHAVVIIGVVAAVLTSGLAAEAQTKSKTSSTAPGAFDKLSLGNQKVAASLYDAQTPGVLATGSTHKPLTLNQIAAKRQAGQEWGQIFREMKAQGLVHEKTLRQVVTRYGQFTSPEQTTNGKSSSNGKLSSLGVGTNAYVDGGRYGNGLGGK
jgi:uncharacterized membrane protein YdfJ with MMPL/SSD domain